MTAVEKVLGYGARFVASREKRLWNAAFVFLLALSGCSTLQITDTYTLPGERPSFVTTNSGGDQLRIGIDPDLKFSSFGLLGAPVLPFYFKPTHQKEIVL